MPPLPAATDETSELAESEPPAFESAVPETRHASDLVAELERRFEPGL